jgi:hypothetical protein
VCNPCVVGAKEEKIIWKQKDHGFWKQNPIPTPLLVFKLKSNHIIGN